MVEQADQPASQERANEQEKGAHVHGGARPGSGRKRKAGGKETGPTRSIRLPRELDGRLKAIALRRGKTPEQMLKLLAVAALEKYDEAVII